jgi:hypothetical protein
MNRSGNRASADAREAMPWLVALRHYLVIIGLGNFAWEIAHLPLYTIWTDKGLAANAFAVLHCTAGDLLIAAVSLLGALLAAGHSGWPVRRYWLVAAIAISAGVSYTIFSEWLNTQVRGSWSYRELMPVLPWIGVGLSPLAQWIVIPTATFLWLQHKLQPANSERRT